MTHRQIDLGQRWKSPKRREWPWRTSKAGNQTTDIKGVVYVVVQWQRTLGYCFGYYDGDSFRRDSTVHATVEEAKAAALRHGGIGVRTPVPILEPTEAPVKRRIDL